MTEEKPANVGISGKDLDIHKTFNEDISRKKLTEKKSNAAWLTLHEKFKNKQCPG